jgi:hypothetical protein
MIQWQAAEEVGARLPVAVNYSIPLIARVGGGGRTRAVTVSCRHCRPPYSPHEARHRTHHHHHCLEDKNSELA